MTLSDFIQVLFHFYLFYVAHPPVSSSSPHYWLFLYLFFVAQVFIESLLYLALCRAFRVQC